jgi:transcriptional regulator with XRE-family HTH domain
MKDDFSWAEIGRRIRALRRAKGYSQAELASASRLAPAAISLLENGRITPRMATLRQVASALGCTVRYVICGVDLDERFEHYKAIGRVLQVLNSKDTEALRAFWGGLSAAEIIVTRGDMFVNDSPAAVNAHLLEATE